LQKSFFKLNVILVEPNGPLNVGSIARLCANFEVNELRIVSPKCDIFSLDSKKMALKGESFINDCKIFNNLDQALVDCDLVIGTCGRIDLNEDTPLESPKEISKWISSFKHINALAVLFGREDRGLSNRELLYAHKIIGINTSKKYPSLNLSHAVSIILYELYNLSTKKDKKDLKVFDLASSQLISESFLDIEKILLKTGYLLRHTSRAKISKFKKFILRAKTSSHELNTLRGIVHQINWSLDHPKKDIEK